MLFLGLSTNDEVVPSLRVKPVTQLWTVFPWSLGLRDGPGSWSLVLVFLRQRINLRYLAKSLIMVLIMPINKGIQDKGEDQSSREGWSWV